MFWKFNFISTSHIETILSKENVTLQELMDEDDVLQECKAQNKNLIDFLSRPSILEEMINLIIGEPSEDLDEKVRYKYPNIACELVTSDVQQINDCLAEDDMLLDKLYSFLEAEKPLNPLLASFFSKTMGILITRKTDKILQFLKAKEDFVNLLLNHLSTSAIMDLLLRLITCIESGKQRLEVLNWLNEQRIIQRLICLIDPDNEEDRHCNASQALCDIIRFAREQMSQLQEKAEPDPLLQTLELTETIAELLDHMYQKSKNESVLVNGIAVLLAMLEFRKPGQNNQAQPNEPNSMYFRPESHEQMTALDSERLAVGVSHTLAALKPRLQEFHHLLLDPPYKDAIPTTFGLLDQPLGNTRIHIARLLSAIVATNSHIVNEDLANLGTLEILLDLFFKYSWNNFLHTQVEQCIGTILSNVPNESEEGKSEHPLLVQLFGQCHLVERILDAWEDNEQQQMKPGGNRRGYMGHMTRIANHIAQNSEKGANSSLISEQIKGLPEDYLKKWESFTSNTLMEINKKNQVGGHPLQSSSEDDDADFRDIPSPQETALQQAFSDYQMQQMTSNFIDQFGFNDDEFGDHEDNSNSLERLTSVNFNLSAEENTRNAELFEQACSERIQPFDDADSDEDIWEDKVQDIAFSNIPASSRNINNIVTVTDIRQNISNIEENSSDSDEEKASAIGSTEPPPVAAAPEEMKMEIDQSDPWTANFETLPMDVAPIAMDTANPWNTPSPEATAQTEVGWANFSNFAEFSENSSGPVDVMEYSECMESGFKYGLNSTSEETANDATEKSISANPNGDSRPETQGNEGANDSLANKKAGGDDLAENFNFLTAAGLLKVIPNVANCTEETSNLPPKEINGSEEICSSNGDNPRSKTKETFEPFSTSTLNVSSNGPA